MVGRQVEPAADGGAERLGELQLERRHLGHHDLRPARRRPRSSAVPMLPAATAPTPGGRQHGRHQGRHGRLAVGAGDGHQPRAARPARPSGRPARSRPAPAPRRLAPPRRSGWPTGTPGLGHHQIAAGQPVEPGRRRAASARARRRCSSAAATASGRQASSNTIGWSPPCGQAPAPPPGPVTPNPTTATLRPAHPVPPFDRKSA